MSLLRVDDLHTHFISRDLDNEIQVAKALNGVSFSLDAGRILGLVGETGAGKSLTATSIMGLMMLAASPGTTIHVAAKGLEAEAALDAIGKLVEAKFFEE